MHRFLDKFFKEKIILIFNFKFSYIFRVYKKGTIEINIYSKNSIGCNFATNIKNLIYLKRVA
jgi:hypothetical protein